MAVPFFVPDGDDQRENGSSSQTQSTTSSATQTPLQSPIVNDEHLVQAFYEALSLYSADVLQGTPGSTSPPSSPSCCYTHNNYRSDVFFPQTNNSPRTPIRSQCWRVTRQELLARRLNSSGDDSQNETESNDVCPSDNRSTMPPSTTVPENYDLEEHFTFLAAREHLEEFSGQVPQKKKKKEIEEKTESDSPAKTKTGEQNFVWPTVVTAVVLAVGCGFLVTR